MSAAVATKMQEIQSCQQKGDALFKEGKFREARSWYEQGLRVNKNQIKGSASVLKPFASQRIRLEAEMFAAVADCCLHATPRDQLAALKAATAALEADAACEKALFLRASAFSLDGVWQSRSRFDADKDKLLSLYPESIYAAPILSITPPSLASDRIFAQLPTKPAPAATKAFGVSVTSFADRPKDDSDSDGEEHPDDKEARERQGKLQEKLVASMSSNLDWHKQFVLKNPDFAAKYPSTTSSSNNNNNNSGSGSSSSVNKTASPSPAVDKAADSFSSDKDVVSRASLSIRQSRRRCTERIADLLMYLVSFCADTGVKDGNNNADANGAVSEHAKDK